ncbi:MAG: hypothetical protein L6420_12210 [Elusimicrobia bacterium]|nr:hypothetical protein [Elusimicrobiota bacterium]
MKKIIILVLISVFFLPAYSFDFFSKDRFSDINSLKKQNIAEELSFVSLGQLAAEREEAVNLIEIGNYKFFSTVIIDNNWEINFAIWPENSSMDKKTLWPETELEKGAVYEYQDIRFNITLTSGIISVRYALSGKEFISRLSYDDIFNKLYSNTEKIMFADSVEYAIIRNRDPLNDKDGIITLRRDNDGMFWYSFNSDDIISNQIKWLVGINSVLYGMKIRGNNLVFFSKLIDIDNKIHGKEKLLDYRFLNKF